LNIRKIDEKGKNISERICGFAINRHVRKCP